jgi:hypothetical protein
MLLRTSKSVWIKPPNPEKCVHKQCLPKMSSRTTFFFVHFPYFLRRNRLMLLTYLSVRISTPLQLWGLRTYFHEIWNEHHSAGDRLLFYPLDFLLLIKYQHTDYENWWGTRGTVSLKARHWHLVRINIFKWNFGYCNIKIIRLACEICGNYLAFGLKETPNESIVPRYMNFPKYNVVYLQI